MTVITEQERSKLETLLEQMNTQQSAEFGTKRAHSPNPIQLAESILNRDRVRVAEGVYMGCPLSADDHRTKAKAHQDRADELKAGEKKDLHQAAADAHTKAADAIDKANQSSAKAVLLD